MGTSTSDVTAPKAPPAIATYRAAATTAPRPVEKPAERPVAVKRDQVEVSSEAKARLDAEEAALKERQSDREAAKA